MNPQARKAPVMGFRVKSGWAAAVAVGGTRSRPSVLLQVSLQMSEPGNSSTRQPYHRSMGVLETDPDTIAERRDQVRRAARASVAAFLAEASREGVRPLAAVVVGSAGTDPDSISNPHIRAHALEGQLFTNTLVEVIRRAGAEVVAVGEPSVWFDAERILGLGRVELKAALARLGESRVPWRADQKVAALAAWLRLTD